LYTGLDTFSQSHTRSVIKSVTHLRLISRPQSVIVSSH